VISTKSMLILDQRTLQVKYRVPAADIYRLSLSPFLDNVAVFHIKSVGFKIKCTCLYYYLCINYIQLY